MPLTMTTVLCQFRSLIVAKSGAVERPKCQQDIRCILRALLSNNSCELVVTVCDHTDGERQVGETYTYIH